jgi:nucleoside-diphosphate-sugar epimerase
MIPCLIEALLQGRSPKLTAGSQLWDYLYVEDAARAIVAVVLEKGASGVFNLGSGQAFSIRSIAERVRDRIDPRLYLDFGAVPYRADQVMHLEADIGRLHDATGWKPEVTIDDGLARTVDWHRERERAH